MLKNLIRATFYRLPASGRMWVRKLIFLPADLRRQLRAEPNDLKIPNKGDIYIGSGGDFVEEGRAHITYLSQLTTLSESSKVLDIGCGIGRTALPLTKILKRTSGGIYRGFDPIKKGISWCQKNITPANPHFDFTLVDLHNDLYNDKGGAASSFVFPYEDEFFDIAFSFSVFTHILPDTMETYLKEIGRTLKTGGQCLLTAFVIDLTLEMTNDEFRFPYDYGHYRLMNDKVKSANVAILSETFSTYAHAAGLRIQVIHHGYWRAGHRDKNVAIQDFQDVILLEKH